MDIDSGTGARRLGDRDVRASDVELALSGDGRTLAVATRSSGRDGDRSIIAGWNLATFQPAFADWTVPFAIGALAIGADGTRVAAGAVDGRLAVYDALTGRLEHDLAAIPPPPGASAGAQRMALRFLDDGRLVATSLGGRIRIVDPHGEVVLRLFGPPNVSELNVLIDADQSSLVTVGAAGMMRYELSSGRPLWNGPSTERCVAGSWLAEQPNTLVCAARDGRVVAVDLATGAVTAELVNTQRENVTVVAAGPERVLGLGDERSFTTWSLDGTGLIQHWLTKGTNDRVIGYLPTTHLLLIARDDPDGGSVIDLVDTANGDVRRRFDPRSTLGRAMPATSHCATTTARSPRSMSCAVSPTGREHIRTFAVDGFAAIDRRVFVWQIGGELEAIDLDTGAVQRDIGPADLRGVFTSDDGRLYVVTDTEVERVDPTSASVEASAALIGIVDVAVRGQVLIASTAGGELVVLDAATLEGRAVPTGAVQESLVLASDGRRLLARGRDGSVRLIDVSAATPLGTELASDAAGGVALDDHGLEAAAAIPTGIASVGPRLGAPGASRMRARRAQSHTGRMARLHRQPRQLPGNLRGR